MAHISGLLVMGQVGPAVKSKMPGATRQTRNEAPLPHIDGRRLIQNRGGVLKWQEGDHRAIPFLFRLTDTADKTEPRAIMIGMSFARGLLIFALPFMPWSAEAQSLVGGQPIGPGLESTAQLAGVLSEVTELRTLSGSTAPEDRWRTLWLHQLIFERIMAASLQVDAAIAQIDNEIARANEVHSYLADRRDRTVNRLNLLSVIVGGGVGATSSGLQLSSSLVKPAAGVGIGAGTLSASLALAGIRAQKGKSSQIDFQSNMLAEFFDRPVLPDSRYPETIWTFLNESAPSSPDGRTRKQQLVQTWINVKRIDSLASVDKIRRLTSQPSERLFLSIDDLEDRAAMLQDVRARISFLKRDFGALIASLPPVGGSPEATSLPFSK